ncbi:hypothetical protein ACFVFH_27550 [Streptomyces sp. NPDC057697]|uniref:SHOCT-like domain-containing protein n=1 Tax=Streptomyces sp. NPDC057697 TaxID=3346219 RepID=UPI0036A98978
MNEQRRRILDMLAEGRITADEAERLIDALERERPEPPQSAAPHPRPRPRYLRVLVSGADGSGADGASRVDVQIPLQLLRAGVRLASLVPPQALTRINVGLSRAGVPIDLAELKPQHIEDFIEQLDEVTVDVDDPDGRVRVFCE